MSFSNQCMTCKHHSCAKKVTLFESFSDQDLENVLSLIERMHFHKGETIFSEGDIFDRLYIVNSGSFKVYRQSKDGKEQVLYVIGDGDFIGDINLLKKDIFKFSAIALEETHLCTIKKDDFDILMRGHPNMVEKVLEYAHDRIASLEELMQTLTSNDVESRVATLLLKLAESFGIQKPTGVEVQLSLTREEMASFIGLTRETLSRKLSQLQAENYIELLDNKRILIKNMDAIQALSAV